METTLNTQTFFKKHIALPQDHGSWVFLLSPLLIGLFAGQGWSLATLFLVLAAFTAFLIRQPITIAVKALSGRRSKRELPVAFFWFAIYSGVGLAMLSGLMLQGFGFLLILALPALPVFAWHLVLVSRRSERRQIGVELLGSGVLALAAPAALWVNSGWQDPAGWWLFFLTWFQSAASIVYAYLRLEQRVLLQAPTRSEGLRMANRALLYGGFNLAAVLALSLFRLLPPLLPLPYALQMAEIVWGTFHPAVGVKPTRIGLRQLLVSTLFTILFILMWKIPL